MIKYLLKKITRYIGIMILALLILPLLPVFLTYRKYQQYKIIRTRKRRLNNGINLLETIKIGGIKQWVSVRGEDTKNPLLLILHGGPGFSMMPYSFIFDSLESNFIIVQWDQRGTGKTFSANKKTSASNIFSTEQMHLDTLEIVNYLRNRFKKEKIFLLGHSWGSVLGLKLAQDHPELLHAYIGVGQFINAKINEKIGYNNALKIAYEKNNKKAIEALKRLTSFQHNDIDMKELLILRKWQFHLNGILIKKSKLFRIMLKALSIPEYSLLDYISLIRGLLLLFKSEQMFREIINIAMDDKTKILTKIFIFGGSHDPITPSLPVYEYYEKLDAKHKEYIWFEKSGHNLFFEEPDKFIRSLLAIKI